MASLPNHNNASAMAAGAGPAIPPGMTQEKVKELFQNFQLMKARGTPTNDPELLKVSRILQAVSQNQAMRKAQRERQAQLAQQQGQGPHQPQMPQQGPLQQQAPMPQQANGQAAVNGAPAMNGQMQKIPTTPIEGSAVGPAKGIVSEQQPAGSFTKEQAALLRLQILAFKCLSNNRPIPTTVQQQLFHARKNLATPSTQPSGDANAKTAEPTPAEKTIRHWYDKLDKASLQVPEISYAFHRVREQRQFVPALLPRGVDVNRVRKERENIVHNRIVARQAELESLPSNMAHWDTSASDAVELDDSLKLKSIIELKMLRLLDKQRELRFKVSREMLYYDNLAQTANRSLYRRQKKINFREARMTQELERRQRDARASNEKKKAMEQMQAILLHGKEVKESSLSQRSRAQKLGRMMQTHHQQIEKEEQKRIERTAKQRLQALKNDDEATYLKLLGQAKDSRISHLLKQTDGFLTQLAASVKQQQREAVDNYGGVNEELPEEDEYEGDSDDEGSGPKVDYYEVAHRIKEEVTEQANMLVGGTLKEYQVKGLQWMISLYNNNLNGILADEMGLGKTIQTISLITYLIEKKRQNGPFLVIVPLSTLTNWNMEFEKWAPSVSRVVYKGPPNARKTQQQQIRQGQFQVLLTTYEYIIKDRPVLSKIRWLQMIIDEGHRMKNASSKLSSTLSQYYHTRFRLILTGTPLQNNLPELWALLNFVLPTIFKSVKSFDEWFNTPFANTGGQDRMELTEEEQLLVIRRLHKVLRPFLLRRLKKDVEKDLPDKQERVIKCKFSALQAKLYKQLMTHSQISVSDGKGGKTGIRGLTNMLMQLRKLCNHPFVFEQVEDQMNPDKTTNDLIWRTAGKFELLDRILPKFQASGHRVLMFFQMTQIMNIMEDFLRLRGMTYLRLDGSTKSDDRSELLHLFNAENSPYFCFLLSTRAGGLGLNLQTADTVIIYDSDWNPHQDLQAQDRAHRIGQKNEVRILRLISSGSIEEKILERARYKLDMDGKVIQAGKFDNKSTNEEREDLLRTLLDAAETIDTTNEQEEMDDDDLNANMARSDGEVVLFHQMDIERNANPDYGPDRKLPRLMCEAELPELYLSEENPVQEVVEEYAGRGARERTKVKYDDGLTEEQWLMAVDDDEDTIEDAIQRKTARIEKRATNKEKRAAKETGADESSPIPSRESSEEPEPEPAPAPAPKKRGRKSQPSKRKAEEDLVDETPPAKKKRPAPKGKSTVAETLSPRERDHLQKVLESVYQHLMDLEEPVEGEVDDDGDPLQRGLIDPFLKLVPKAHYPDYYIVIKEPIAMDTIQKKINRHDYQSLLQFVRDIRLLFNNARTYNEDGSQLYIDANVCEESAIAKLKADGGAYPEFVAIDFDAAVPDDDADDADPSTVNPSSAATPAPPGPRLKLSFNAAAAAQAAAAAAQGGSGSGSGEGGDRMEE